MSKSSWVCLSVREDISEDISGTTRAIFTKFFVHVVYVLGSAVLRHVYDRPHRPSPGRGFLPHWKCIIGWGKGDGSAQRRRSMLSTIALLLNGLNLGSSSSRLDFVGYMDPYVDQRLGIFSQLPISTVVLCWHTLGGREVWTRWVFSVCVSDGRSLQSICVAPSTSEYGFLSGTSVTRWNSGYEIRLEKCEGWVPALGKLFTHVF